MMSLRQVTLPSTLESINFGVDETENEGGLDSRFGAIPKTWVEQGVFSCCINLCQINLQQLPSLEIIGAESFYYTSLDEIYISQNIKSIGSNAFAFNGGVFIVSEENENYSSQNGHLYNKDKTVLINCNYKDKGQLDDIAETVTTILKGALNTLLAKFENGVVSTDTNPDYAVQEVIIPDSVETIESGAFILLGTTQISFGEGLLSLADGAFAVAGLEEEGLNTALYDVYFEGILPPVLVGTKSLGSALANINKIYIPDGFFEQYYKAFYDSNYAGKIDLDGIPTITFNLINTDGENPASVTAPCLAAMPTVAYGGAESKFLHP